MGWGPLTRDAEGDDVKGSSRSKNKGPVGSPRASELVTGLVGGPPGAMTPWDPRQEEGGGGRCPQAGPSAPNATGRLPEHDNA